jgi:hypothetical protein
VEFRVVSGWTKPSNKTVTIIKNQTVTTSGTYTIRLPDLVVSAISIPNTTIIYGKTPWTWVSFTVKNQGAAPVTGVALQGQIVNMTRNGEPYSTGGYFNINYTDPLAPGGTATQQFAVGHDSAWPVGRYTLQVKVDHVNAVPESNENNNVSAPLSFEVVETNNKSLAGTWLLTNYLGNTFYITLEARGTNRYYFLPTNLVPAGLYEVEGDYLVMIEPYSPHYTGFIWEIINTNYLYLTTTGYKGSTLTR